MPKGNIKRRAILGIVYGSFFLVVSLSIIISDWAEISASLSGLIYQIFLCSFVYALIIISSIALLRKKLKLGWIVGVVMITLIVRFIFLFKSIVEIVRGNELLFFPPFGGMTDQFIYLIIPLFVTMFDYLLCILLKNSFSE